MVIYAVLLVFLALAFVWLARATGRLVMLCWRAIRARRGGFDRLPTGPVALRGRVVSIDTLISPETGRKGVYLSYTADRWQRTATLGGLVGQWIRAESDEQAAPFELTDGNASVLVDPHGAMVLVPLEVSLVPQPDSSLVNYREGIIEEDAELIVMGNAIQKGGFEASSPYRGHSYRSVIRSSDDGRGLLIAAPRLLQKTLVLRSLVRALAAACVLAGLAFILSILF